MAASSSTPPRLWQRIASAAVRFFHAYGNWLVSISWKRFLLLSLLLLMSTALLDDLPPFSWKISETVVPASPRKESKVSKTAASAPSPIVKIEDADKGTLEISIGQDGVRVKRLPLGSPAVAQGASAPTAVAGSSAADRGVLIWRPEGATGEVAREVLADLRSEIGDALEEAERQAERDAAEARRVGTAASAGAAQAQREASEAIEAKRDVVEALRDVSAAAGAPRGRTVTVRLGDSLPNIAMLWIVASIILKITYKGRMQAEVKAAQATETAESESLKRQVVEARMAAMQAQVEPHFLFNTLASIDHLIETDPPRASTMQKNLIALLRASMPTLRDAQPSAHNLGREMAVIKPYLEILKVRMEERLQFDVNVPEGLLSAEFPSMMVQSLVENAVKHGLEPKAEGGRLSVKAEIIHGKLAVTVADTGLGFGKAATAGTGTGLANIRERLKLLYGGKASITVGENTPGGTVVTLTVPYVAQAHEGDMT
ncbi:MAG: histidine kinase [Methylibium sp. NZG]|nr:MAG: histidine kinase [Methylibium sp. NZG]